MADADMTKSLSGTTDKNNDSSEGFMAEDTDTDPDGAEAIAPVRPLQKDPTIRRKIEDRLERKRLREELGIYDDDAWDEI